MKTILTVLLLLSVLIGAPGFHADAEEALQTVIHIDAGTVRNRITPWMTGSCIEDVNHEIYGGLYAQRIFGESFEEPPSQTSPLAGWTSYGGIWQLTGETLSVSADAGAKLVRNTGVIGDGSVECDLLLADARGGNASLILRVSDPHIGPDRWNGYEIALSAHDQTLSLSRHHNDWHLLKAVPAAVPPGKWLRLHVDLQGRILRVFLEGASQPALEFTDDTDPLLSGSVGVRTWNSDASFRNLAVTALPAGREAVAFHAADQSATSLSGMWDAIHTGSTVARFHWDTERPFNSAYSQRIEHGAGEGVVGVANRGLNRWGIAVRAHQRFAGRFYLREQGYSGQVTVALQSADGAVTYALQSLPVTGSDWHRYDFALRANAPDPKARFALWIDSPGTVWVDQVTLTPTGSDLFEGLPIRADIADMLRKGGITFLRYGGSMVNAPSYRWKNMLGDPDKRPQSLGTWYPNSTNGFGIEEFVQFCRAAQIEPAFAINIEEDPADAADMVEYLNGAADTPGGRRRAANGHPEPYNVRYIEIGNEEAIDGNHDWYVRYLDRFQTLYDAMHPRDPHLQFVIAAWWRPQEPMCRKIVETLNGKAALWDVHVGGDGLYDGTDVDKTMTEMQRLFQEWAPGADLKACIFEENGGRHDLQRALGHAHILNVTQRHGDFVLMDCPANCLQPWLQNDNGWDQGQVFFTPDQVWGMPPYYAQQMAAETYLPLRVESRLERPDRDLDVTATRSEAGDTLVIKVVNLSAETRHARIDLHGFHRPYRHGEVWTLSGELQAVNSPEAPKRVHTVKSKLKNAADRFSYDFAPHSYTILRLKRGVGNATGTPPQP